MLELGAVDLNVGVHGDDSGRACIISCVALKLAIVDLKTSAFKHCDAGHLTVCLTEYSTKRQKYSINIRNRATIENVKRIETYSSDRMQLCILRVPLLRRMMQYYLGLPSLM